MDRSTARNLLCLLLVLSLGLSASAQTPGILTGIVIDGVSGTPVPNATVEVDGTGLSSRTDLRGSFRIDVASGTHAVTVKVKGYGTEKIAGVELLAGKVQNLGVVIMPKGGSDQTTALTATAEVVVTVQGPDSTEESLLVERRSSDDIADNIGAREMTRGSVTDAASAVQRVVGVSLVSDKYVFIRGLGERYSSTRLNGTVIPSTEPEKKVVALDLFPSSLLEKITVAKSYSADKPGEFAGGVVDMESTDFPASPILSLQVNGSSLSTTTGEDFGEYAGGLGVFGKGGQPLPPVPAGKIVRKSAFGGEGFTQPELQTIGRSFVGTWQPDGISAPLNSGYSLSFANTFGPVGILLSGTTSHPYKRQEEIQKYYATSGGQLFTRNEYSFTTSEESVKQGFLANFGIKLGDSNRLKLRGFLTNSNDAESRLARYFDEDESNFFQDTRVRYQKERILAGQLGGEHYFADLIGSGTFVDWKASLSEGHRNDDLRQNLYEETSGGLFYKSGGQSGFLLYNELTDRIFDGNLDITSTLGSGEAPLTLKVGGAYTKGDRDFSSRRFRFIEQPGNRLDFRQAPNQLFAEGNISPQGFEIAEETRPTDTYVGENRVLAGYAMGDLTAGALRIVLGARVESARQSVRTFDLFNLDRAPIVTSLDDTDLLPSLSLVYQLGAKTNLRAAVSQTVNRPQFRELAPFEFTDIAGGRATIGNPNLTRALIRNFDLRWELFPSGREVLAVSLFYKDLKDPIERTIQPTATLRTSYANVAKARNLGAEVEARVNLGTFTPSLSALTLIANYTYVDSKVTLGQLQGVVLTSQERPLEGQSDSVVNATLEFAPVGSGLSLQLFYNFTGPKISDVGALGIPDIYEEGRGTLDLTWAQDLRFLLPGLSLKATASNLTNEEVLFTQGGLLQRQYSEGRKYALSIKYGLGL